MPKKSPRNAYFFYMLHFQKQEAKQGRYFKFSELASAASHSWKAMTTEQRGTFKKMAENGRRNPQQAHEKYTAQGISISQIRKQEQEAVDAEMVMKKTIQNIVMSSFINNIGSQEYYFVDGNFFMETNEKLFVPAEIAMVKFTFQGGIVRKFHTYVNPGYIAMGYAAEAKEHSEKTHNLPIPPNSMGEKNYGKIFHKITMFLGNSSDLPPLYTLKKDKNIPMIVSFLNQFCKEAQTDLKFRVFPLQQLFFDLKEEATKNSIGNGLGFQSIHIANSILDADQFAFLEHTACNYHDQQDCSKDCALSKVQKWAFTFAANICRDLNIPLIAGQQLPAEVEISYHN